MTKSRHRKHPEFPKGNLKPTFTRVYTGILVGIIVALVTYGLQEVRFRSRQPKLVVNQTWQELTKAMVATQDENTTTIEEKAYAKDPVTGEQIRKFGLAFSYEKKETAKTETFVDLKEMGIKPEDIGRDIILEPEVKRYFGKILVSNKGSTDLTNIRLVLAIPFDGSLDVFSTPNVQSGSFGGPSKYEGDGTSEEITTALKYYSKNLTTIPIAGLPPNTDAIITIRWHFSIDADNVPSGYLRNVGAGREVWPKIFLAYSKEANGEVKSDISLSETVDIEWEITGGSWLIPWWPPVEPSIILTMRKK